MLLALFRAVLMVMHFSHEIKLPAFEFNSQTAKSSNSFQHYGRPSWDTVNNTTELNFNGKSGKGGCQILMPTNIASDLLAQYWHVSWQNFIQQAIFTSAWAANSVFHSLAACFSMLGNRANLEMLIIQRTNPWHFQMYIWYSLNRDINLKAHLGGELNHGTCDW